MADLFELLHKICPVCYCEPLKEQSISLSTKQQWKEAHNSSHWLSTKGITSHDSSSMAQGQEWNVILCAVGGETEGWEDKRMCRVNTERQYQELRVALSLNRMQGSCREKLKPKEAVRAPHPAGSRTNDEEKDRILTLEFFCPPLPRISQCLCCLRFCVNVHKSTPFSRS